MKSLRRYAHSIKANDEQQLKVNSGISARLGNVISVSIEQK